MASRNSGGKVTSSTWTPWLLRIFAAFSIVPGPASGHIGDFIRATLARFRDIVLSGRWSFRTKTSMTTCRSSILRAKTPRLLRVVETGFMPSRGMLFQDAFMAKTPVYDAGRITLPAVCIPKLSGTWQSATAAADPVEEPPGVRFGSCGLVVLGPALSTVNSVVVVLPTNELSVNSKFFRRTNQVSELQHFVESPRLKHHSLVDVLDKIRSRMLWAYLDCVSKIASNQNNTKKMIPFVSIISSRANTAPCSSPL